MTTVPTRFATSLASHGYGHALYEPISSQELSPGSCGFLDGAGTWTPIVHLADPAALAKLGLTACTLDEAPESQREWGPKASESVKGVELEFKGDASLLPAGIPASIGALVSYSAHSSSGAILLTKSPVTKRALRFKTPFHRWMQQNARRIVNVWPDVLTYGLLIVTSTYTTAEARTNMLSQDSKGVKVGFEAGFTPVGEIGPMGGWYTSSKDSGWVKTIASQPNDEKVVFFGGFGFRWPLGQLATNFAKPIKSGKDAAYFRGDDEGPATIQIAEVAEGEECSGGQSKEAYQIEVENVGAAEHISSVADEGDDLDLMAASAAGEF